MAWGEYIYLIYIHVRIRYRLKTILFSERDPENNRPEETHVQAVPRRVHRTGKNREYLHEESVRSSNIRPRRIIEIVHSRDSRAGSGRSQVLGTGEQNRRYTECTLRQC